MEKITYALLGSLGEEFHRSFDTALDQVRQNLGLPYPLFIDGNQKEPRPELFLIRRRLTPPRAGSISNRRPHRYAKGHRRRQSRVSRVA